MQRTRGATASSIYKLVSSEMDFGIVEYDHNKSVDYSLFLENFSLKGLTGDLIYSIKKKSDLKKLPRLHFLQSTGPKLVSDRLRAVIEKIAPDEAEFFEVKITHNGEPVSGFSAINLVNAVRCVDMEKSEYTQTNFDANDPAYSFTYFALKDNFDEELHIASCKESNLVAIVTEEVRSECANAGLSGLLFCRATDMTYKDRSDCKGCTD